MNKGALILLHLVRGLAIAWSCGCALLAVLNMLITGSLVSVFGPNFAFVVYGMLGACVAAAAWIVLHHVKRGDPRRGFGVLHLKPGSASRERKA